MREKKKQGFFTYGESWKVSSCDEIFYDDLVSFHHNFSMSQVHYSIYQVFCFIRGDVLRRSYTACKFSSFKVLSFLERLQKIPSINFYHWLHCTTKTSPLSHVKLERHRSQHSAHHISSHVSEIQSCSIFFNTRSENLIRSQTAASTRRELEK